MSSRLAGILLCVLLANVLNYALGSWLERQMPELAPLAASVDGSAYNTSRYYENLPEAALALSPDAEALLDFYVYLDEGGRENYAQWRTAYDDLRESGNKFRLRALEIAHANNTGKYLALLLLIVALLLRFGHGLHETFLVTPLLYFGIFTGTAAIYGGMSSPLYTVLVAGTLLLYFGGLRLFLPIYHTEWTRLMRPGLTLCVFLLAVMAWRGPGLINYWFWTSPLFRLGLVTVVLLTVFFHLSILSSVLKAAKMDFTTRLFAFGMPLGVATLVPGLFLGLFGKEAGDALQRLNFELVWLPPETVAGFNPDAPFVLFFAGVMLLILAGIGYFIQKIAR